MRSDRNLHGHVMFADDVVTCSQSREQVEIAWPQQMECSCVDESYPSKQVR